MGWTEIGQMSQNPKEKNTFSAANFGENFHHLLNKIFTMFEGVLASLKTPVWWGGRKSARWVKIQRKNTLFQQQFLEKIFTAFLTKSSQCV